MFSNHASPTQSWLTVGGEVSIRGFR